jgi:hypothetical protein
MSKVYWRFIVALGIVALFSFISAWGWLSYLEYQNQHNKQRESVTQYKVETVEQYFDVCIKEDTSIVNISKCFSQSIDANRNAQRSQYDLQAQQDMAEWAYALFLLTMAGLIVSVAGLIFLFWSLRQTRTAIKDNREIGEAQTRAYIYVADVVIVRRPNNNIQAVISFSNTGQTPAKKVTYAIERIGLFSAGEDEVSFGDGSPESYHEIDDLAPSHSKFYKTPHKSFTLSDAENLKSREISVYVWGVVKYADVFGKKFEIGFRRTTDFVPENVTFGEIYSIPKENAAPLHLCMGGNYSKEIPKKPSLCRVAFRNNMVAPRG